MAEESSRVYIGDLGTNGSKQEIEEAFKNFGSLKSVWVARNPPGEAAILQVVKGKLSHEQYVVGEVVPG